MLLKIQIGSVVRGPAVKFVTTISSNDSANASSAPATIAVRMAGNVTQRNVVHPSAPRSIEASTNEPGVRRRPRDDVVVDDDDAERGVADHDQWQAERDPERC